MEKYWWYKTDWHQKTVKALKIAGMSEKTQQCYTRAMRMLVEHFNKTPDLSLPSRQWVLKYKFSGCYF